MKVHILHHQTPRAKTICGVVGRADLLERDTYVKPNGLRFVAVPVENSAKANCALCRHYAR